MRKVIKFVVTMIWQFSRVCAAVIVSFWAAQFLILIFYSVDEPKILRVKPEPNVCGKISGRIFEFSRKYVMFWPEYEGKSSWESGFINNKKGCDANFLSLMMALSWPDLKSVSLAEATSEKLKSERLILTIGPGEAGRVYVGKRLEYALEGMPYEMFEGVEYIDSVGLYHVRGAESALSRFDTGYYWDTNGGRVEHVIYCMWLEEEFRYYSCEIEFFVPRYGVFFKVGFTPDKLNSWREIVKSVVEFAESGIKHGVK